MEKRLPERRSGDNEVDGTTIFGTVKWYDPIKGYGFIAREDGGDDLFVHRSAVDAGGLNEGDRVTCDVVRGLKGSNAERVRVIERSGLPPRGGERGYRADDRGGNGYPRPSLESLPLLTGTIKRYDAEKGYGFISPDDGSADVFVHRTAAGVDAIGPGDRIEFRLGRGPKGPRAEQVRIIEPGQRTDAWSARGNY